MRNPQWDYALLGLPLDVRVCRNFEDSFPKLREIGWELPPSAREFGWSGGIAMSSRSVLRRTCAAVVAAAMVGAWVAMAGVAPAAADTSPEPGTPETVSADALPTTQIDGVAWSQVIVGNTVYVGGNFQTARPAGSAPGQNTVSRPYLLAYDLATGALVQSFAPSLNGQVLGLAASPDGSRIYAVGDFTKVNGANRYRIVALNSANGSLISTFVPGLDYRARAIVATANTVYVGGSFNASSTFTRSKLVAFNAVNGAVTTWNPGASGGGNQVMSMALTTDGSKLIVGGNFLTLAGQPAMGLGAVDPVTGDRLPWNATTYIKNAGLKAAITTLAASGDSVYGGGYVTGTENGLPKGNLEGTFSADAASGNINWLSSCHGDTYQLTPRSGMVYSVGHPHDCRSIGGFAQTNPWTFKRAIALEDKASGVNDKNIISGYFNWEGTPAPKPLDWYPEIDAGTFTGQNQGAWTIASNSDYIVIGGEFPAVNGQQQQGLVRFAKKSIAPNQAGPVIKGADYVPALTSPAAGLVRGSVQANWDRDNESLTYRIFRQGSPIAVYTTTLKSTFYNRPMITFSDSGVTPGQTYNYRVIVTDPLGNVMSGDWASVAVASDGTLGNYPAAVMSDGPQQYWRFNEAAGPSLADSVGRNAGVVGGSVSYGAAGALVGDAGTALTFPGDPSKSTAYTVAYQNDQQRFAEEAWFKTTTTKGGRIIGFSNGTTGDSGKTDRHVYMLNNGRISFGVNADTMRTITSPGSYNDGVYHHVVAQLTSGGAELYIDGALVASDPALKAAVEYNGYWRVGGDTLAGWPNRPTNSYFAGTIDEVAVYPVPLSADRIQYHYLAGTQLDPGAPVNSPPVSSFSYSVADLTASFDGTGSTDSDGTVDSYQWDFGDGAMAVGTHADHTFATGGTYPVRLTVTDNQGASATSVQDVTVVEPNPALALDTFGRSLVGGWGSTIPGGSWVPTGATTSFSVEDAVGKISLPAAGQTRSQRLSGVSSTSTDTSVDVSTARPPGGSPYAAVQGRSVNASNDYRVKLRFMSNGGVSATLNRNLAGVESTLAGVTVPGLSFNTDDILRVRLQVSGTSPTTLRAKVWRATDPEPADWLLQATDSAAALQVAGSVALWTYLSSSVTAVPVVVRFDNLSVYSVH